MEFKQEQIEHYKQLEKVANEREKRLQATIAHYQKSLVQPVQKKHKEKKQLRLLKNIKYHMKH